MKRKDCWGKEGRNLHQVYRGAKPGKEIAKTNVPKGRTAGEFFKPRAESDVAAKARHPPIDTNRVYTP